MRLVTTRIHWLQVVKCASLLSRLNGHASKGASWSALSSFESHACCLAVNSTISDILCSVLLPVAVGYVHTPAYIDLTLRVSNFQDRTLRASLLVRECEHCALMPFQGAIPSAHRRHAVSVNVPKTASSKDLRTISRHRTRTHRNRKNRIEHPD